MRGWPMLSLITLTPLLAAGGIMLVGRRRPAAVRGLAAGATIVTLALALDVYLAYDPGSAGSSSRSAIRSSPPSASASSWAWTGSRPSWCS